MQSFEVYIINLDKSQDRMNFMKQQMEKLDIKYTKMPAIYGKEYNFSIDEYDRGLARKTNGQELTEGEKGCALSHRLCYNGALEHEYTLIMEDDVLLPDNFKEIIEKEISKNKNQKWEYLTFDYIEPGFFFVKHYIDSLFLVYKNLCTREDKLKFTIKTIIKLAYLIPISIFEWIRNYIYKLFGGGAVKFYRPLYLAGCYLVTRSAADKLTQLSSPIRYPADRLPDEAKKQLKMKFYAYAPLSVFQQREQFSSNIVQSENANTK